MTTARAVALRALVSLEKGERDRLQLVDEAKQLESRELAFATELANGVLRRERVLDHVLSGLAHRGLPKDPRLVVALRLGAYQLLFLEGMPAHAAVHETVELVRANKGFANALLRRIAGALLDGPANPAAPTTVLPLGSQRSFLLPLPLPADELERLAIVYSLPDWLVRRVDEQHGREAVRAFALAAAAVPGVFLRCRVDQDRAALAEALRAAEVETEPAAHPLLLRWTGGASPFGTAVFRDGRFVVQDASALRAAEAVAATAGDIVVDLCAAPGTKTTLLAERVAPNGRVFAFDPDERRRRLIHDNLARLGQQQLVNVIADVAQLPRARHVLVDAPCSNSGVLGRRVEARRRLEPAVFARMAILQKQLLRQALDLVEPGGTVVYSTCSVDREENDAVVDAVVGAADAPACEVVRREVTIPKAGEHEIGRAHV